jgi:hypothetical protein
VPAQRPQRRILGAYLDQVCFVAVSPVTLRRPAGDCTRRIFWPADSVHLHRVVPEMEGVVYMQRRD